MTRFDVRWKGCPCTGSDMSKDMDVAVCSLNFLHAVRQQRKELSPCLRGVSQDCRAEANGQEQIEAACQCLPVADCWQA